MVAKSFGVIIVDATPWEGVSLVNQLWLTGEMKMAAQDQTGQELTEPLLYSPCLAVEVTRDLVQSLASKTRSNTQRLASVATELFALAEDLLEMERAIGEQSAVLARFEQSPYLNNVGSGASGVTPLRLHK